MVSDEKTIGWEPYSNLLEKTGARNTAGLVLFAIKTHLLDPFRLTLKIAGVPLTVSIFLGKW